MFLDSRWSVAEIRCENDAGRAQNNEQKSRQVELANKHLIQEEDCQADLEKDRCS